MEKKIRISYIITSLSLGGAEGQLLHLLKGLNRDRFEPGLVLLNPTGVERADGAVTDLFCLDAPAGGYSQQPLFKQLGVVPAAFRLWQHWKKSRPEIIHAFMPASIFFMNASSRIQPAPLRVISRRSLSAAYRPRKWLMAAIDRKCTHWSDFSLGNSHAVTQEIILDDRCPPDRAVTIYNGVDTVRFHPGHATTLRSELGWTGGEIVFGKVGNFRTGKRYEDFLDAAALVLQRVPQARFLLLGGDQGELPMLRRKVSQLGIDAFVRILTPEVPAEKVYAAMDVSVCTSGTEGFSNVLLEAMASGKPVIATRVGGNAEAVVHGDTGLIVSPYRPAEVAEAALTLAAQPELRRKMGVKGRLRVEKNFSIPAMVKNHEALYLRLLASRDGTGPNLGLRR